MAKKETVKKAGTEPVTGDQISPDSNTVATDEAKETPKTNKEEPGPDEKLKEKAKMYFTRNPVDEIHITADGYGFYKKPEAVLHALRLQDKNVITFKRGEV